MKNSQPQIYRAWKRWIGQLVFLRGDCFQKSIVLRPSHTSPLLRGSFPRLDGPLWSGAVSGRVWRQTYESTVFWNKYIYIFLCEARGVTCSRGGLLLTRFFWWEMIERKEKFICSNLSCVYKELIKELICNKRKNNNIRIVLFSSYYYHFTLVKYNNLSNEHSLSDE